MFEPSLYISPFLNGLNALGDVLVRMIHSQFLGLGLLKISSAGGRPIEKNRKSIPNAFRMNGYSKELVISIKGKPG